MRAAAIFIFNRQWRSHIVQKILQNWNSSQDRAPFASHVGLELKKFSLNTHAIIFPFSSMQHININKKFDLKIRNCSCFMYKWNKNGCLLSK